MRLKNFLITVTDVERAKAFYKDLFGLDAILDNGRNLILTGGLVLQDRSLWEEAIGQHVIAWNNSSALYFEEPDIEAFAEKLSRYEESVSPIRYICPLTEIFPGRRVIRFYDPDGNLIEVGTPWR